MTTAEWVERIDRIRREQGFDGGTWQTFATTMPNRLTFVPFRPRCRWCQKPLKPKQLRRTVNVTCSISCGQRLRGAS